MDGILHPKMSRCLPIEPPQVSEASMIMRSVFIPAVALLVLLAATKNSSAQTSDIRVQGPWVYGTQVDQAEAVQEMATTMAMGDDNVWLLLVCSQDRRLTISVMHLEEFSYPVESRVHVSLRIDTHPKLTMPAVRVDHKQISIDPASSHDLLPLLLDSNRSSVTIPDSLGSTHQYSFVLQPNGRALSNIRARCLDHANQ